MRFSYSSLLILALCASPGLLEAEAPWSRSKERQIPWRRDPRDADRKQRRENFFRKLPLEVASESPSKLSKEKELGRLPWGEYSEQWKKLSLTDSLLWPVEEGKISSGYGLRSGRFHEGLDIVANQGSGVRAVATGYVVFSGSFSGYGKTVVIYHGDGFSSIYAHNQKNLVSEGQQVQAGEQVALLGQSGETRGTHLHFEIRKEGEAVNPLGFSYKDRAYTASAQ